MLIYVSQISLLVWCGHQDVFVVLVLRNAERNKNINSPMMVRFSLTDSSCIYVLQVNSHALLTSDIPTIIGVIHIMA